MGCNKLYIVMPCGSKYPRLGDRVCQWFVVGRNQKNRFCMKLRVSEGNCIFMYFAGVQKQL